MKVGDRLTTRCPFCGGQQKHEVVKKAYGMTDIRCDDCKGNSTLLTGLTAKGLVRRGR